MSKDFKVKHGVFANNAIEGSEFKASNSGNTTNLSYTFTADTNTGFFNPAGDTISVVAGNNIVATFNTTGFASNLSGTDITTGTVADARIANTLVRDSRTITAGNGLIGGGNLTANRTLNIGTPSTITISSTNTSSGNTHNHQIDLSGRTITAGSGLTGGGNLGADRTLNIGTPSTITISSTNVSSGTTHNHQIDLSGRTINTGNGLSGGGNLGSDRTIAVVPGSGLSVNSTAVFVNVGVGIAANSTGTHVVAGDGLAANSTGTHVVAGDGVSVNSSAVGVDSTVVRTSRTITAGSGLTGGGNLNSNRTIAVNPGNGLSANSTGTHVVAGSGVSVNSTAVGVDSTVVRTTGDQTIAGNKTLSGITNFTGNIGVSNPSPAVSLDLSSKNDAVRFPNGTTAQRPSGQDGMLRFNSTMGEFEGFSTALGGWSQLALAGSSINANFLEGQPASWFLNATNLNAGTLPGARFNDTSHGTRTGGNLHAAANSSANGFMTSADFNKLAGIPASAVPTSTTITAGNGLTGGGNLGANRTISLGTPSTLTTSTTNAANSTSHTHNLDLSGLSITAGNGLTGGGTFAESRTITLGTPSTITTSTTNTANSTSHTHNLDLSGIAVNSGSGLTGGGNLSTSRTLAVNLSESHIPALPISKITNLQSELNAKARDFTTDNAVTVDFNTITTPGPYTTICLGSGANGPGDGGYYYVVVFTYGSNLTQVLFPYNTTSGAIAFRTRYESTWSAWRRHSLEGHTHNASDLTSGTVPNARISGSYTGLTNLSGSGDVDFARFLGNASDTVAAPSISWTSDTDTGMYRVAANQIGFTTGGTHRVTINSTGLTAAGNVGAYSDVRLKSDIKTITDALDKVVSMRGTEFTMNGQRMVGVIAQEIQEVLPEVVNESDDEMKILSVAYGNIVGVLIEAIKELKEEVDILKSKK